MMLVERWFPFFDVGKTLKEMDRIFGNVGRPLELRSVPRGTFPAINVYEQDDGVVLTAEIPGIKPDELDLTVLQDCVTLKGQRKEAELGERDRYYRRERPVGAFTRTVTLPETIDPDSVNAQYKDGILRVHMAKAAHVKAKKIKIRS